jgi:hypothetical protein
VKLDINLFPEFHERTPWVGFNIQVLSLLTPHYMTQLLDPDFVPISRHEEAFRNDDALLYSILNLKVKCTRGREFLMEEVPTLSGQRVWGRLAQHYLGIGNIVAERNKDDAFRRVITPLSQKMGTNNSKRMSLSAAISQWENDLKTYIIYLGQPIPPKDKLEYFRRFIADIKDLQHVHTTNNMVNVITNSSTGRNAHALKPDQVIEMYKQHAEIVDADNRSDMVGRRGQIVKELRFINHVNSMYHSKGYDVHLTDFSDVTGEGIDNDVWYGAMMNRLCRRHWLYYPIPMPYDITFV